MRKELVYISLSVVLVTLFSKNLLADTINVPEDYPIIQEAIDNAQSADTVLVSSGMYRENINFKGKDIVLGSLFLTTGDVKYISQTIIKLGFKFQVQYW